MPEEAVAVTETSVEQSSAGDSDAGLQQEMTGDFFYDDGVGAVVDNQGNTQFDAEGNPIRSMDGLKKPSQSQPQAQTQKQGAHVAASKQTPQSSGFDSLFEKDGKIDFEALNAHGQRVNEFSYTSTLYPKEQPADQGQQQQQPQAPVDPRVSAQQELKTYQETLESHLLAPLRSTYETLTAFYQQRGEQMPYEVYNEINEKFIAQQNMIKQLVDEKREEQFEARQGEMKSQAEYEGNVAKSRENFGKIADEFFPNTRPEQRFDRLAQMVFGYDQNGKFVRGYGADVVDHLFDQAHEGKSFKTAQEYKDAYNRWWSKYSSNPTNIKYVVQRAHERYMAQNHTKIRDAYRQQWEKELAEKSKQRTMRPSTGGSNAPDIGDSRKQLDAYFGAPTANM